MSKRALAVLVAAAVSAVLPAASPAHAAVPKCFGKKATIVGTKKANTLKGTKRADVIVGLGGDDVILGQGGNDLICGGGGGDRLSGLKGNDKLDLGPGSVDIGYPGLGDDLIKGRAGDIDAVSYFDSATPVVVDLAAGTATGQGTDTIIGVPHVQASGYDDSITGNDGTNWLFGLSGADFLDGGGGDDQLYGYDNPTREDPSDGGDTLIGGDGGDALVGGTGNDTMDGGAGIDGMEGGTGDDTMDGGGDQYDGVDYINATQAVTVNLAAGTATGMGNDTISGVTEVYGSDFNDTLIGSNRPNEGFDPGPGDDSVDGGSGPMDAIVYQFSPDAVTVDLAAGTGSGQWAGNDTLTEIESVYGTDFADTISGNAAQNDIFGLLGDDTINGREGNDTLDGEGGTDALNGGTGQDTCLNGETNTECESTTAPARTGRRVTDATGGPRLR